MNECPTRRELLGLCAAPVAAAGLSPRAAAVEQFRRGGMLYRRLGRTDLFVSLLSFGSHTDPTFRIKNGDRGTVLNSEGQARRDRQIALAFDLGVNLLDVYESEGQWEPAAKLVRGRRDRVLLSLAHTSPEFIGRNIDRAARLYGHIDMYRYHTHLIDGQCLEFWDVLRKAKEAGRVRAIGISTHNEPTMMEALDQLDGLDYIFFPYNFIHARADYSQFLPAAARKGVGLVAMKPLAAGSIVNLDPRARAGARPESERIELWQRGNKPVLPAAVAELTKSLDRLPEETLCMAAMRFVYSRPFVACAIAGMFDEQYVNDNCAALTRYQQDLSRQERATLDDVRYFARLRETAWLPARYRWLEEQWRA
jgi:aryl-alcohol dehydrogenase-like predicted oxidoreductase